MVTKYQLFSTLLFIFVILGAFTEVPNKMLTEPQFATGSSDWMRHREDIYSKRRVRIRAVCEKYKNMWQKTKFPGREFLFDLRNRLAYCRHEKVRERAESSLKSYKMKGLIVFCMLFG